MSHVAFRDLTNLTEAYALGGNVSGVTVGVLDTPVRVDHPELAGRVQTVPFILADGTLWTPVWDSSVDHGTHVSGIFVDAKDGVGALSGLGR